MSTSEWRKRERERKVAMVRSIARHAVAKFMRFPLLTQGKSFSEKIEDQIDKILDVAYADAEFHGVSKRAVKQEFLKGVKKQMENILVQKGLRDE